MYYVIAIMLGIGLGFFVCYYTVVQTKVKELVDVRNNFFKFEEFYWVLVRWIKGRNKGASVAQLVKKFGEKRVAIYGMKELGALLLEEFTNEGVDVVYAIDNNADNIYLPIDIYKMSEDLPDADIIIVTAIHYFDEIKDSIDRKMNCQVISLNDLVKSI